MIQTIVHWFEDFFTKGGKRIHAAVLLIGTLALSASAIILSLAVYKKQIPAGVELAAVCAALSGVIGYAYGKGKTVEEGLPK